MQKYIPVIVPARQLKMISKYQAKEVIKTLTERAFTTWPELAGVLHAIVCATQIMVIGPNVELVQLDCFTSFTAQIGNDNGVVTFIFCAKS